MSTRRCASCGSALATESSGGHRPAAYPATRTPGSFGLDRAMANASTVTTPPDPTATTAPFGDLATAASDPAVDPCDIACAAMPGYVIGDLLPRDQRWLTHHTGGCRYCSSMLSGYQRIDHMLDRLDRYVCEDTPPPPLFLPDARPAGYARMESPLGPLFIAASDRGLCEIGFGAHEHEGV